jgi:hypothetical protein
MAKFFVGLLFFVIGIAIFFFVDRASVSQKDFVKTYGIVVDYYEKYDNDGYTYSEIVEFEVDGQMYTCQASSSSSIPRHVGSEMEVIYNPKNPKDARVGVERDNLMLRIIGGVFGLAGLLSVFVGVKEKLSCN